MAHRVRLERREDPLHRAVVVGRVAVVQRRPGRAVGGHPGRRHALAEVLHPPVVAAVDGFAEQRAVEGVDPGSGEVELGQGLRREAGRLRAAHERRIDVRLP